MNESTKSHSPLRQRMIEEMTMRKLAPATQSAYLRVVKEFTRFLGRSPDTAEVEDLRRYQLHLVERGKSNPTINNHITGLKFFFAETLDRPELMRRMQPVYQPRRLPEIPSVAETTKLLQCAGSLKYQAALGVAYGAGLRVSEITHLKVSDIDSQRQVLRVEQGKGGRDRYAMLSPTLLRLLRAWWREGQAKRTMLPGGWLFPGQNPVNPLTTRQLNRAFHQARQAAGIDKSISPHGLRHAFATHLLDRHVDIRIIQVLLGHKKIENTARYSHVAASRLREVKGPLEYLDFPIPE